MPALWIAHVSVTDEEAYGRYAKLAGPAIAKHGGAFIARGGRYVQLEGKDRPRNVVAKFPSVEAAACSQSRIPGGAEPCARRVRAGIADRRDQRVSCRKAWVGCRIRPNNAEGAGRAPARSGGLALWPGQRI